MCWLQDPVEILDEYGADAMRLYLITSPVVHGDSLAFKAQGVYDVIRNVFLPWYNAYRFLVQNVLRHESETGTSFDPTQVTHMRFCLRMHATLSCQLSMRQHCQAALHITTAVYLHMQCSCCVHSSVTPSSWSREH